jgi:hypothetical protein
MKLLSTSSLAVLAPNTIATGHQRTTSRACYDTNHASPFRAFAGDGFHCQDRREESDDASWAKIDFVGGLSRGSIVRCDRLSFVRSQASVDPSVRHIQEIKQSTKWTLINLNLKYSKYTVYLSHHNQNRKSIYSPHEIQHRFNTALPSNRDNHHVHSQ